MSSSSSSSCRCLLRLLWLEEVVVVVVVIIITMMASRVTTTTTTAAGFVSHCLPVRKIAASASPSPSWWLETTTTPSTATATCCRCRHRSPLYLFTSSSRSSRSGGGKKKKQRQKAANDTDDNKKETKTAVVTATTKPSNKTKERLLWEVYIDQSKQSLERGGSATLDAFWGLLAPSYSEQQVLVQPALLQGISSNKAPVVRCIYMEKAGDTQRTDQQQQSNKSYQQPPLLSSSSLSSLEVTNVDSVDKVYRILTKHMRLPNISTTACTCLKWKYKGNGHLEGGEIDLAIEAYNKALSFVKSSTTTTTSTTTSTDDVSSIQGNSNNNNSQEGMILLMRATAFLRRAAKHQQELKEIVQDLIETVPSVETLQTLYSTSKTTPILANAVFRKVLQDTDLQEELFRKTQYRHGLYQYALLQAAQDALRATQLLPIYATSWLRAGEILSELWKLKESAQYYERAMALDPSLSLRPIIDRLKVRQELLDNAKVYGWSEDTLRLALDVSR